MLCACHVLCVMGGATCYVTCAMCRALCATGCVHPVCCVPCAVYHVLCATHCVPCAVCHRLCVCCVPHAVCCVPCAVCHGLCATGCVLCAVCHALCATGCVSHTASGLFTNAGSGCLRAGAVTISRLRGRGRSGLERLSTCAHLSHPGPRQCPEGAPAFGEATHTGRCLHVHVQQANELLRLRLLRTGSLSLALDLLIHQLAHSGADTRHRQPGLLVLLRSVGQCVCRVWLHVQQSTSYITGLSSHGAVCERTPDRIWKAGDRVTG